MHDPLFVRAQQVRTPTHCTAGYALNVAQVNTSAMRHTIHHMESHPDTHSTSIVSHNDPIDIISMVPFELSHKIFSHVGDYKTAVLVCRRWKSLVANGIASGVLLSREEIALIEFEPLGVRSLDITDLCYHDMGLESIPNSVGALSNLKELRLCYNALVSIPASVEILSSLEWLDVSRNALVSIPDCIGSLTNLMVLYLSENELNSIPDTLGSLTNLTKLYLSENALVSIPDTLGSLTNLSYLNLNNQKSGVKLSRPPLPSSCTVLL